MRNETRIKFADYSAAIAKLNGVTSVENAFTVAPSVQQTLETKIQESSAFLKAINMPGVRDMEGEKIGLGVTGTVAGRTKTTPGNPRRPRSMAGLSNQRYRCVKTDFDTAFPYPQLDTWAKFPDFQQKLRDLIINQQALDRIMIGFNGRSVAENTDRAANPLLQDVNIGWLQQYRNEAPDRVMNTGAKQAGKVLIGKDGDYENLDALVFDAINVLIEPQFQEAPDLVVICGREMLADKYFPLINKDQPASEKMATDIVVSQKRMGGLQVVRVPFFPPGTLMITRLANLSLYWQEEGRRRHVKEEPEYNQVANYESSNDAYVVELYEAGCVVENITIQPTPAEVQAAN